MIMRKRLFATLLSSLCLIAATSLLIAFIKLYTVPHTLTNMFIPTSCRVVDIDCGEECLITGDRRGSDGQVEKVEKVEHEQINNHANEAIEELDRNSEDQLDKLERINENGGDMKSYHRKHSYSLKVSRNNTIVSIKEATSNSLDILSNVSYGKRVIYEGSGRETGTLKPNGKASNDVKDRQHDKPHLNIIYRRLNNTSDRTPFEHNTGAMENEGLNMPETDMAAPGSRCCYEGFSRCDKILVDVIETDIAERVPLIEDPWIYYSLVTDEKSSLCTCPSCHASVHESDLHTVDIGGATYTLQTDIFPCYLNTFEPEVLLYKMSTLVVLNLMFWPTLFFMVGFVGLFFSCLYLQYEECTDNWCARTLRI